jgi:tRNA pseudouridine38-40 synthase
MLISMRNIKLTLEYEGTDFCGWQVQPEGRTVQGLLQEKLGVLLQEPVKIIGAGRTDAGVHAQGQVANFTTASGLSLREIQRGLNSLLSPDVVIRQTEEVSEKFHARYDAASRHYRYRLSTRPTALHRNFVWSLLANLDLVQMQETVQLLMGTHDFAGFCLGPDERPHCVCTVQDVSLKKVRDEIHFHIVADRFLRAMVRVIVGRLVDLGRGRLSPERFSKFLERGADQRPIIVVPPQGLCLLEVTYPRTTKLGKGDRG